MSQKRKIEHLQSSGQEDALQQQQQQWAQYYAQYGYDPQQYYNQQQKPHNQSSSSKPAAVPDLDAITQQTHFKPMSKSLQKPTSSSSSSSTVQRNKNTKTAPVSTTATTTTTTTALPKPILRAAGAQVWHDANISSQNPSHFYLHISNLPRDTLDTHLRSLFAHFPSLVDCKVIKERDGVRCRGYGFVGFSDPDDYLKAFREVQGQFVNGRPVVVKRSTWQERNVTHTQANKIRKRYGEFTTPKTKRQ